MKPEVSLMGQSGALSRQFVRRPCQAGKSDEGRKALAVKTRAVSPAGSALVETGAQLSAWLEARGMSQAQFSARTGLAPKTVGKHVKAEGLPKIVTLAVLGLEIVL